MQPGVEWNKFVKVALAADYVLSNNENFTDDEIVDACLYALRKYGSDYPALGKAAVKIIHQKRLSEFTVLDCLLKQKRAACHA